MNVTPALSVLFLGSGSSGNACAVTDGTTTVLLDCGFAAREVTRRLSAAGIAPASVSAVVLTHEHSDHVRGVDVFVRRHAPAAVVMGTRGTLLACSATRDLAAERVSAGESLTVGTITITPFATSHDAEQPVGYRFDASGDAVGIATDTGVLTEQAREVLSGVRLLGLESNHDIDMLENGPYPRFLKRRILSRAGHLSNECAADALEALAHDGLEHVVGLHRSSTNNTMQLARRALVARVAGLGLRTSVHMASQDQVFCVNEQQQDNPHACATAQRCTDETEQR